MIKALLLVLLLLICGCAAQSHYEQPKHTKEMTIDEKVSKGINTGTPADLYIRDPNSVFQPYSPYNVFQN